MRKCGKIMAHAHGTLVTYGYKYTLGICHCIPQQQRLHEQAAVLRRYVR